MDPAHFVVGALTAATVGLLVWVELRSRRKAAQDIKPAPGTPDGAPPARPS